MEPAAVELREVGDQVGRRAALAGCEPLHFGHQIGIGEPDGKPRCH